MKDQDKIEQWRKEFEETDLFKKAGRDSWSEPIDPWEAYLAGREKGEEEIRLFSSQVTSVLKEKNEEIAQLRQQLEEMTKLVLPDLSKREFAIKYLEEKSQRLNEAVSQGYSRSGVLCKSGYQYYAGTVLDVVNGLLSKQDELKSLLSQAVLLIDSVYVNFYPKETVDQWLKQAQEIGE